MDIDNARTARTAVLPGVGRAGVERLARARVLVVGAGGLGSPVIQYLAAAGVGTIGIVDDDRVDASNLQRQLVHGSADVGSPKTESAARAVAALDPAVEVVQLPLRLDAGNAAAVLRGWDVVVDGSDNLATRYAVSDAAGELGIPEVWGAVLRFEGQLTVFSPQGPAGPVDYRDLHPIEPDPATVLSCEVAGVLGPECGVIGSAMAVEVLKLVTGVGEPLVGRVLHHDALAGDWREIPLRRSPERGATRAAERIAPARIPTAPEVDLAEAAGRRIIDVREPSEREGGHLDGDVSIPLARLLDDPGLAGPDPVLVYCASGIRSARAADALLAIRVDAVSLRGGYRAVPSAR